MALVVFPMADTTTHTSLVPWICNTRSTLRMLSASFTEAPPNLKTLFIIFFDIKRNTLLIELHHVPISEHLRALAFI